MKKRLQIGITFLFLFMLLSACSNAPRNTGESAPSDPLGWSKTSDLSKGVFFALATDPTDPNVVYAASSTLSVYKTADGGVTWTAANRGLPGQPVRSLVVDPIDPLMIFAAAAGGELYKTNDGGDSWQVIGSGLTQNTAYAAAFNSYAPPSGMDVISGEEINSLSWNAVPNATAYRLYYFDCSSCTSFPPAFNSATWQKIDQADPTKLQYVHTGLNNATPYYYVLTAFVGGEETATSAMVSSRPAERDTSTNPRPDGIKVTAGDRQNTIRWNTVSGAATRHWLHAFSV